jgi:hypothetical protein
MKIRICAALALVTSSFTPAALPGMISAASAQSVNPSLCSDVSLLGPVRNGHTWGTPEILPSNGTPSVSVEVGTVTTRAGSSGNVTVVVTTTTTQPPVIQRCPVLNSQGNLTDKYQDVELAAGSSSSVTEAVKVCQNRGQDGTEVTSFGLDNGYTQQACESLTT